MIVKSCIIQSFLYTTEVSLSSTTLILTFYKNFKEEPLGCPQLLSHITLTDFKGVAQVYLMEDLVIQCYIFRQIKMAIGYFRWLHGKTLKTY